jgi:leucyl aminopeptidase
VPQACVVHFVKERLMSEQVSGQPARENVLEIEFAALTTTMPGSVACLVGSGPSFGPQLTAMDTRADGAVQRAVAAADFKGKARSSIEILAPAKLSMDRLVLVGTAVAPEATDSDWSHIGGVAYAQLAARRAQTATLLLDGQAPSAAVAAEIAFGAVLRSYTFKKYRTKSGDDNGDEATRSLAKLTIQTADPDAARTAFGHAKAVAEGMFMARDLVNEPANVLGPVEFAEQTRALTRVGVEVEILDVPALEALKMGALLGVGMGSAKPSRVVVMTWSGAKSKRQKPVCFVGKGVTFDTGGISIKPAAGMEDMKGDMGGAACVTGLMHALAARKANVNAVGLIGLVENMPSHMAQRPGDIVTSMSGQTIEVLNTDAEGRLVLADVLWYAQERFKPKLIVDLATLTGAIMVALGKEYAGMFSNDDDLAKHLSAAGDATGEKVWRMPLARAYDKLIDSKTADMKNIGGRFGGAITAAQFLQRFIKGTPWAHLDVAGVAMDSNKTDISQGWASGWGVRLLDRLVADHHEKG